MNFGADGIPEKDRELLDLALEGKSDTFKVKVFEIVRKFKLDASDPSFLLLLSTGQLEVLLEEFPVAFESLFTDLLARMQQQYRQSENALKDETKTLRGVVEGITAANKDLSDDLTAAVGNLKQFSEDQAELLSQRVEKILGFAEKKRAELAEEVKQKENAEREKRAEAYKSALQKSANKLIEQAGTALKAKHTKELILPLVLGSLAFTVLGGSFGHMLGQNQVRSEYAYKWALEHYRVNYKLIKECEKIKRKTCNVFTIAPDVVPQ